MESRIFLTNYKACFAACLAVGMAIAWLYLWGYWGRFGINIFEYASVADLLASAAKPALIVMLSTLLAVVLSRVATDGMERRRSELPQSGKRLIAFRPGPSFSVFCGGIGLAIAVLWANPARWIVAATFWAFACLPMIANGAVADIVPNWKLRVLTLLFFWELAAMALTIAEGQAENVVSGKSWTVVDVGRSGLKLQTAPDKPVMYVGHFGDHFFLFETATQSLVILVAADQPMLIIKENPDRPVQPRFALKKWMESLVLPWEWRHSEQTTRKESSHL